MNVTDRQMVNFQRDFPSAYARLCHYELVNEYNDLRAKFARGSKLNDWETRRLAELTHWAEDTCLNGN